MSTFFKVTTEEFNQDYGYVDYIAGLENTFDLHPKAESLNVINLKVHEVSLVTELEDISIWEKLDLEIMAMDNVAYVNAHKQRRMLTLRYAVDPELHQLIHFLQTIRETSYNNKCKSLERQITEIENKYVEYIHLLQERCVKLNTQVIKLQRPWYAKLWSKLTGK